MENKFIRYLAIVLMIATVLSFSGCYFWSDTPSGSDPEILDTYCFSITTNETSYNYGDEIEITTAIQFTYVWADEGVFTVFLEESPYFEIIGEKEYVFENIKQEDYCCLKGTNKIITKFKIKIEEPCYAMNYFNIMADYKPTNNSSIIEYRGATPLKRTCCILDSQGIIVHQTPYSYDHGEDGVHGTNYTKSTVRELGENDLIAASLNREYLAGASIEDLIDRYVEFTYVGMEKPVASVYKYYSYNSDKRHSVSYVSSGLRFKIYLPADHEYLDMYDDVIDKNGKNHAKSDKKYAEMILRLALDNNVITEKEYNAEIERIYDNSRYITVGNGTPRMFPDNLVFDDPRGDDYFNYVFSMEK